MSRLLFCVVIVSLLNVAFGEKLLLCYYGSWATYRQNNGKCQVADLNPFMCTHLIYTFVGLNDDASIRIMDPWLELPDNWGKDNFGQFNKLKKINPKLKTIIAIGGWNEGSRRYSQMANSPTLRAKFVKNAAEFTMKYGFDGFDVDWEYPGQRDSPLTHEDIAAHAQLLKEMRVEFDKHGLLLTAAVASVKKSASQSYNIREVSKYLDLINVMTYDLHGAWDSETGHNAALHHYEMDVPKDDSFDVETAIDYWISEGADRNKLILGMPLYGRSWNLLDMHNTSVGATATGPGLAGQYTNERGMIGLNELCEKRLTENWDEHWDDVAEVPYTFKGSDWISYDNHKSLQLKCELAMAKGLAGVMIWSIETDDFRGLCHNEKYAFLRTINKAIGREVIEITTTEGPTSSTEEPSTTSTATKPPISTTTFNPTGETTEGDHICKKEGYVRDLYDCSVFYNCVNNGQGGYTIYKFKCPMDLYFDDVLLLCNLPELVDCTSVQKIYGY